MCDADSLATGAQSHFTRRAFGLLAAAMTTVSTRVMAQENITERAVEIKTPDGLADAALFHPQGAGPWPAVLVWPDIWSLRPVFQEMGRRLAASGYVVLAPNLYFRQARAPVTARSGAGANAEDREKIIALAGTISPSAATQDALAYIDFLESLEQTDRRRMIGVQGYCMGGPLAIRTAAARPKRVGAVASFHGAELVRSSADSPHLLIPQTQAQYLIEIAENDDQKDPGSKDGLLAQFAAAGLTAKVEVVAGANHGWTVKGSQAFNPVAAETAWVNLLALYAKAL